MKTLLKNSHRKAGQMPGSLIYMGEDKKEPVTISVSKYNKESYEEKKIAGIAEIEALIKNIGIIWINTNGIHQPEIIGNLGNLFNIHPLIQEDILNTGHRPKTEDLGDYLFIVIKMLSWDDKSHDIKSEQISMVVKKDLVISFQEDPIDDLELIRESLRQNKGRIRELGADYLAYRILDVVLDKYFYVLEKVGERIEHLEDELIVNPSKKTLQKLYRLKSDMVLIRRAIWPLREVIGGLEKVESEIVSKTTVPYLRDLYDHIVQLIDTNENYRDMVSGMMDIYLSSISNKLNEIMKVLTIISTFFIPLNFIAGLYGMNFKTEVSPFNMPELSFYFGYPMVLLLMIIVAGGLFMFFKRKGWF